MNRESITITKNAVYLRCIPLTRFFALSILAGVILPLFSAFSEAENSAGFLFDRFKLTLENGWRTEAAGPFYYSQQTESNSLWVVPPFFSRSHTPEIESDEDDFLYPLFTDLHYGREKRWQFFQLLSVSSGLNPDDDNVRQFTLFPIYFQQRAADTNLNYTAFFPFYGHLKQRLFKDEIYFVMFPFYCETRKRDVITENYFYPFVDTHHGDGMTGWQVWPIVGREHKEMTTQTNGFGDVTFVGGHDHSFFVWPLCLKQDNGIGTDNPEKIRAAIPFFSMSRSPQHDSTTVLWPFFTWIDDRARSYHERQAPWPFVIFANGTNLHVSRIWPIFSQSHTDTHESDSYLWPLYTHNRTQSDPLDRQRTRVAYYLYDRLSEKNTETGHEKIRLDMWPFFTWHHAFNGNERLQVLAPLEPAVPDNPGIEKNWSPLWSLWRAEKNPTAEAASQSLLWNLYRRATAPEQKKVSFLFGLFQYQLNQGTEQAKVFYFTVSQKPSSKK